jgi:hypothetical protein
MAPPKLSSRENGRLSCGPKSQTGKERSKMKGLRHGIFASEAVLYNDVSNETLAGEIEKLHQIECLRRFGIAKNEPPRLGPKTAKSQHYPNLPGEGRASHRASRCRPKARNDEPNLS